LFLAKLASSPEVSLIMNAPPSTLNDWSYEAISYLLHAHCFEDANFDWKREFPRDQKGKDRLVREAVAMANNGGGFIIFGVADQHTSSPIERICGVQPDKEFAQHLHGQLCRADPPVRFQPRNPPIAIPDSNSVIQIVQILSISAPHSFENIFYRRTSGGSAEPMKTQEVQKLFVRWNTVIREAPMLQHIRQIRYNIYQSRGWEELERDVAPLRWYAQEGSVEVRREVLEALTLPLTYVRAGMPAGLAGELSGIVLSALRPYPRRPKAEQGILMKAIDHGFSLAYDGALYLQRGLVVWEGGQILAEALTIACRYELASVESHALQKFEGARNGAARAKPTPFVDAVAWLRYKEEDAIARGRGIGSEPQINLRLEYRMLSDDGKQRATKPWDKWSQRLRRIKSLLRL
jgi:hypothetical protein